MNVTKYRILDLIAIICSPNKGYKTVLAIDYSERMLMSEISTGCGFYNNLRSIDTEFALYRILPCSKFQNRQLWIFFAIQGNNRYLLITANVSVPSNLD